MQNLDFYNGNGRSNSYSPNKNNYNPTRENPEFFSRVESSKESAKKEKKASRIFFLITALAIVSFTTGLVIGIKFAGGKDKEIVDKQTFNAVAGIGHKMSDFFKDIVEKETFKNTTFPKNEYPFVLKVGKEYTPEKTQNIAKFLSTKGHTVILAKNDSNLYNIYIGPYKKRTKALELKELMGNYKKHSIGNSLKILKRE